MVFFRLPANKGTDKNFGVAGQATLFDSSKFIIKSSQGKYIYDENLRRNLL
jgi:hypothetical protein